MGIFQWSDGSLCSLVLEKRIGLDNPVLVAMEDAPDKPDPTGLFIAIAMLEEKGQMLPVVYVGDTAADIRVIKNAIEKEPTRQWRSIGVIPPHARTGDDKESQYSSNLQNVGADIVLPGMSSVTPKLLATLF